MQLPSFLRDLHACGPWCDPPRHVLLVHVLLRDPSTGRAVLPADAERALLAELAHWGVVVEELAPARQLLADARPQAFWDAADTPTARLYAARVRPA
jgi:hypothetical protein